MEALCCSKVYVLKVPELYPGALGVALVDERVGHVEGSFFLHALAERVFLDLGRTAGADGDFGQSVTLVEGVAANFLNGAGDVDLGH